MLAKAAAISGISSINSFVLNAAIEKAKKIIDEESVLILNQQDAEMLVQVLDKPAHINNRLEKAAQIYENNNQENI